MTTRPTPQDKICNSTTCLLCRDCWDDPDRLCGLIIIFIALLFTVIIILNKVFQSASPRNSLFIVLTLIIWVIGTALLNVPGEWIDRVIAVNVTSVVTIVAILLGVKLKDSTRKWRIVLFSFFAVYLWQLQSLSLS
ncbi:unnamed protein product [Schistosoma turkestanicum]|nr:unnamed protein product [Schistosoma turkestanicum]